MKSIEVSNLSFEYPRVRVLENLSLEVPAGSFLCITGPNGSGKSTLIKLLCGLLKARSGSIRIDGKAVQSYSVRRLAQKVAVVRQEFVPAFGFTVAETVLMARTPYYGQTGFETKLDREIAEQALEATETREFASRRLGQLSGGERQRVFIARALAQNSPILLLDEPASFLDLKHRVAIYDLLKAAQLEDDKTIVAVTHDVNLACQYADAALLLSSDNTYYHGCCEDVFCRERIERVFGVKTFTGRLGREKFFIALGKFAKDSDIITGGSTGGQKP